MHLLVTFYCNYEALQFVVTACDFLLHQNPLKKEKEK